MKVFLIGATGDIGRRVVPALVTAGHDVTAVARSERKASTLAAHGVTPARIEVFDRAQRAGAVAGHDVVVNLATAIPPAEKMILRRAWRDNDRIRRDLTAMLAEVAREAGVGAWVQESICFTYGDHGSRWIDEDAPLQTVSLNATTADAEANVARFTAAGGRGVVLRFGQFFAPDAGMPQGTVDMARKGRVPLMGDPTGYETWVHLDDAATAVVAALDAPAGTWNVCESDPATKAEHLAALGDLVGHEVGMLPALMGRLPRIGFRARSQRASNRRFRDATGWTPAHPRIVEEWGTVAAVAA